MARLSKATIIRKAKQAAGLEKYHDLDLVKHENEWFWAGCVGALFDVSSIGTNITLNADDFPLEFWTEDLVNKVKQYEQDNDQKLTEAYLQVDWVGGMEDETAEVSEEDIEMPSVKKHHPTPAYITSLVESIGTTPKRAAESIGISEKALRCYMQGLENRVCPYPIQFTLECLAYFKSKEKSQSKAA